MTADTYRPPIFYAHVSTEVLTLGISELFDFFGAPDCFLFRKLFSFFDYWLRVGAPIDDVRATLFSSVFSIVLERRTIEVCPSSVQRGASDVKGWGGRG